MSTLKRQEVQGQPKSRLQRYKGDRKFQRLQAKCEKRSIIQEQLELEERKAKRSIVQEVKEFQGQPKRARLQRYKGDRKFQRLQAKCEKRSIAIQEQLELEDQEVEEVQDKRDTKISPTFVMLDGKEALQFYSKSKFPDAKYLSNFTEYNGTSVEKEFCKAKYEFCQVECPDLTGLTGVEVKKLHGKKHLTMDELSIASWNHDAPRIMYNLICNRCNEDPKFADLLTKYKYFLHQENRSRRPIWGGRMKDGVLVGKNKLGSIMARCAMR
jgi:hypothetical protein